MIPCQCCRTEYPRQWSWFVCSDCDFRVCAGCLSRHTGRYSTGGFKCSQCAFGQLRPK